MAGLTDNQNYILEGKVKKEELAEKLNGRERRDEMSRDEERQAENDRLVIVFGASDDLMEFRGAVYDEIGCYGGGTAYFVDGILANEERCECRYYQKALRTAKTIKAVWDESSEFVWSYQTDIPHATFEIYEGSSPYCKGIVFSMGDLK